ncbi:MAG TPA: ABC transporter substrate-binding protein [Chloroflexota bacterium]|nr:ABC transporter substrate-binding protein [Chloroflexota bacterium]
MVRAMNRASLLFGLLSSLALAACGSATAPSTPAASSAPAGSAAAKPAPASSAASASAKPATSAGAAASPAASGLTTLKVAHAPSTLFAPLYIAIDKGYMKQQGIDVSLTTVTAGQDAQAFLATGQLDAAVAGIAAATFNAVNQGLDIRIVGSMGAAPANADPSALMVRADELDSGAVKSLAGLKGKKVALSGGVGAAGSFYMAQLLAKDNLKLSDIEVINLSFPDIVAGFKGKSIDASIVPAPFTTVILKEGSAKVPDFGHLIAGVSGTGTVYGQHLLRQDRQLGQRFFNGLIRGAADVQGDKARDPQNLDILAKATKLPVATLKTMALYTFKPDLAPDTATYNNMQQVFIQAGVLKFPQPLPTDKIVDGVFSKNAKP